MNARQLPVRREPTTLVPRRSRGDAAQRFAGDEGMTLIWVAALMIVLLVFAALAIDGGQAYASRRQSQNASDAGAMAGIRALDSARWGSGSIATIDDEIVRQARNSGGDGTTGGVRCWLLSFPDSNGVSTRTSGDICSSGSASQTEVNSSWGVEVRARITKSTFFAAAVMGDPDTAASTVAKAYTYAFAGGTSSPFIVCGYKGNGPASDNQNDWAFDILNFNASTGVWSLKSQAVGKYYNIQDEKTPLCGGGSDTFKGKGKGVVIPTVPFTTDVETGNGFNNSISLAVTGSTPCQPGDTTFNGCAMLIPIASQMTATGSNTTATIVMWTVWNIWGDGSPNYSYSGQNNGAAGVSCNNPIRRQGGSPKPKYCGQLLGRGTVVGGNVGGPGGSGANVLKLGE